MPKMVVGTEVGQDMDRKDFKCLRLPRFPCKDSPVVEAVKAVWVSRWACRSQ